MIISYYNGCLYLHVKFPTKSYWKVCENIGKTKTITYYNSIMRNQLRAFMGFQFTDTQFFLASNDENFQFSSVNKEVI